MEEDLNSGTHEWRQQGQDCHSLRSNGPHNIASEDRHHFKRHLMFCWTMMQLDFPEGPPSDLHVEMNGYVSAHITE